MLFVQVVEKGATCHVCGGEEGNNFSEKLVAVKIQNKMQNMQNMSNRRNLLHQNKSSNRRARILLFVSRINENGQNPSQPTTGREFVLQIKNSAKNQANQSQGKNMINK